MMRRRARSRAPRSRSISASSRCPTSAMSTVNASRQLHSLIPKTAADRASAIGGLWAASEHVAAARTACSRGGGVDGRRDELAGGAIPVSMTTSTGPPVINKCSTSSRRIRTSFRRLSTLAWSTTSRRRSALGRNNRADGRRAVQIGAHEHGNARAEQSQHGQHERPENISFACCLTAGLNCRAEIFHSSTIDTLELTAC